LLIAEGTAYPKDKMADVKSSAQAESVRVSHEKQDVDHLEKSERASIREEESDPVEARKIIRKIDYRILPLLILLYTLTFLDRVNIGNARLWNMEKDLKMTGNQYNLVVMSMSSLSNPRNSNSSH
jgi:hypothetical protein